MSHFFPRLNAFLNASTTLKIATRPGPAPNNTLNGISRMVAAAALGVTLLTTMGVSQQASAQHTASSAPSQAERRQWAQRFADSLVKSRNPSEAAAAMEVNGLFTEYLAHGRVPAGVSIGILDPNDKSTALPASRLNDERPGCVILNIRSDYRKLGRILDAAALIDTRTMRVFALVHEDMHCRTMPFLAGDQSAGVSGFTDNGDGKPSPERKAADALADLYATLSAESAADALGILMIARRDGVDTALDIIPKVLLMRQREDRGHNTSATLGLVREALSTTPNTVDSDLAAFRFAIETAIRGTTEALASGLSPSDREAAQTEAYLSRVERINKGFDKALDAYSSGPTSARLVRVYSDHTVFDIATDTQPQPAMPDIALRPKSMP